MSVNKLNLQIGGSREPEEETLLEETGVNSDVDSLLNELFEDNKEEIVEEHGDFLVRALDNAMPERIVEPQLPEEWLPERLVEEIQQEEVALTREERMAEAMSGYLKKTGQALTEVEEVSDSQRIKLLEDAFAQMKRGQPQTLVTGIGASLDSGGGAVWLWDLEDINIGAPYQNITTSGTSYPNIPDGAILTFDKANSQWVAVQGSSDEVGNLLDGGIIRATGGSANDTGNLQIESTDSSDGQLIMRRGITLNGQAAADTITLDANSGEIRTKGGSIVIERKIAGSIGAANFTILGRVVGSAHDAGVLFTSYNSHPQDTGTADSIRYGGLVSNDKDIATKEYVDAHSGPDSGFEFRGTCDVTQATDADPPNPASVLTPAAGDFYINQTAGIAATSWTGIAGLTISADQLIIYSGASSRWFAGAVEDNTSFLKIDGSNTYNAKLRIKKPQLTDGSGNALSNAALEIQQGSPADVNNTYTTKLTIFSGGSINTEGTITCGNIASGNVKPQSTNTSTLGDSAKVWLSAYVKDLYVSGDASVSSNLTVNYNAYLCQSSSASKLDIGGTNWTGDATVPSILIQGGKSANTVIKRCTNASMSIPQLAIEGKITGGGGTKTDNLLEVNRNSGTSNEVDNILYRGQTGITYDASTVNNCKITNYGSMVAYVDANAATLSSSNSFTNSQDIKVAPTQFAITVEPTGSTIDTFRLYGSGDMEVYGDAEFNNDTTTSSIVSIKRNTTNSSNYVNFNILGNNCKTSSGASAPEVLEVVALSKNSSLPDNILYYGGTSGADTLQTRASVTIDILTPDWITINHNSSGQTVSTMTGTGWFIKYRVIGGTVQVLVHAAKNGSYVQAGDIVGVLPSSYHPTYDTPIIFAPKNATSSLNEGYGAWGVLARTGAIAITHTLNDNAQNTSPGGSLDYWANFSFAQGS